jgi:hypothetical protein
MSILGNLKSRGKEIASMSGVAILPLILGVSTISGCGEKSEFPPLGKVNGVIKMDGEPLPNAAVQFQPIQGKRGSYGRTDANGKYTLGYTNDLNGAEVGKHKVFITTEQAGISNESGGPSTPPVKEKLPATYNSESTLEYEVKAGSNEIDIDTISKGKMP